MERPFVVGDDLLAFKCQNYFKTLFPKAFGDVFISVGVASKKELKHACFSRVISVSLILK